MDRYYRIHDFESSPDFFSHRSTGWVHDEDGNPVTTYYNGVCAVTSYAWLLDYFGAKDLRDLFHRTGGKSLVVFEGEEVEDSKTDDCVVVRPVRIVHRFDAPVDEEEEVESTLDAIMRIAKEKGLV